MDAANSTATATSPSLNSEPTMDRSPSDDARSADSGVVLRDTRDQRDESDRLQTQSDLSKLFRLEHRSVVCRYKLNAHKLALTDFH